MSLSRLRFEAHAVFAILGTAIVATSDEFHQSFLPNRGASPWDVLLDCCGAVTMTLIAWVILSCVLHNRRTPISL
jgi:VanZ family protein